ncbi:alkaline phosphatase PhoX [Thermosynechococcus sp.]|uniref:alkaline phosphatase PhoX n=1 Tax=Thermosynechococcus sp. TaxID=2814275 RepID=UPI00391BD6C5
MGLQRRRFLTLAAAGMGAALFPQGLQLLYQRAAYGQPLTTRGFGPLVKDPNGLLDLPAGFQYRVFSKLGDRLSDGTPVPTCHDGMAAFLGPEGTTILVRNHELYPALRGVFQGIESTKEIQYDPLAPGGTTTLILSKDRRLLKHYVSLAGTSCNCGGGKTPWGSWISCEETVATPANPGWRGAVQKRHGYAFEVPIAASKPVKPVPLKAMGRFQREAIAIDPQTNIIYQTEDRGDSLFYRFIPKQAGNLAAGGELQALKIKGAPKLNTAEGFPLRKPFEVEWVSIPEPDPATDTVRYPGYEKGAAQFVRAEGLCYAKGEFYFTATSGGRKRLGQVWRYRPGRTSADGGTIELFVESPGKEVLDYPDNLTMAPWGDLLCCEDGNDGTNRLVGITPQGQLYTFARNALNNQELAGICFSPDGQTLFVNLYHPGMTFAIWGPWDRRG